jgi:YjbE family integral membrane protein
VPNLQALLAIILIDLSLSADNALIIGLVARDLPARHRRQAIVIGGTLAVVFRVILTALAAVLLTIPYLQLVGGLALLVIAYRLARPGGHEESARPAATLRAAIAMIVVADLTTSLEHVLGIGGAAHGDIPLLIIGLAISIPIVLAGSGIVASIVGRFPWTIWLGVLALVWTGVDLFLDDPVLRGILPDHWLVDAGFMVIALAAIVFALRLREHHSAKRVSARGVRRRR